MDELLKSINLHGVLTPDRIAAISRALVVLLVGFVLARFGTSAIGRAIESRAGGPETLVLRRLVRYTLYSLVIATAAHQLGFNLGVLLGAAGVLTVALGFASQTSASNLISGLFLIAERPFVVGDVVTVESVTGEVLSIDLLSTKIRTFNNLFVRVPNEQIIKSNVTNLTRFPIRRADIQIGVAYKEDMVRVERLLREIAANNPLAMEEPAPLLIFQGFGDSALLYQFSVWGETAKFLELRNSIQRDLKRVFDEEGIEIPFPHRSIYTGSVTDPFPIRIVQESAGPVAAAPGSPSPADPRPPEPAG
ncbi:MAG: mechanosensitive ion channel family protein [Candidatus Eisenbacteria bacterium]